MRYVIAADIEQERGACRHAQPLHIIADIEQVYCCCGTLNHCI